MPRPERILDPTASPVHAFAADLRTLREKAGNPTYLKMSRATGKSRTALAEAAGGDHVPRWETVEAYIRACDGNPAEWRSKWEALQEARELTPEAAFDQVELEGSDDTSPAKSRRPGGRQLLVWLATGASVLAVVVLVVITVRPDEGGQALQSSSTSTTSRPSGPVAIVVQNKVAIGTELLEDTTPAYLSSKPIPFCGREGCKLDGTEMWSGAVLAVDCFVTGAKMSNADLASPGIDQNRHKYTSALWYRAVLPGDRTGYISEVYVEPKYRGGLGLPTCANTNP